MDPPTTVVEGLASVMDDWKNMNTLDEPITATVINLNCNTFCRYEIFCQYHSLFVVSLTKGDARCEKHYG